MLGGIMEQLLRDFEMKLKDREVGKGSIETHVRRVSTYLKWCREAGQDPLREKSAAAFFASRVERGNMHSTISAYEQSVRVFLKSMENALGFGLNK
jgi:hypothetical protein